MGFTALLYVSKAHIHQRPNNTNQKPVPVLLKIPPQSETTLKSTQHSLTQFTPSCPGIKRGKQETKLRAHLASASLAKTQINNKTPIKNGEII